MAGRDATRSFLELCVAFAKEGLPRPLGPPVSLGPQAVALGPKAPAPAPRPHVVSRPKAVPPLPSPSSPSSSGEESPEESPAAPGLAAPDAGDDGAGGRERDEGPSDDDFEGVTEDVYQLPALSEDEAADMGGEGPAESLGAASSAPDLEAPHSGDGSGHEEDPPIDEGLDGDEDDSENAFRKRLRLQHMQARGSGVVRAERSHNQFRGGASGQFWRLWIAAPRPILLRPVGSPL